MSLQNRFVLMFVLAALALSIGCSSTNKATPPPTGGFGNTDLNGTYVFSTAGSDADGNFLTMLGTFTACGCSGGTISAGGGLVMNDPAFVFTAPAPALTITGGSYTVGVDGRGTATLTAATPFGTPNIVLDFVLTSTQGGLVTEFDNNGSGSGTLDLQSSVTQAQLAAGTGTFVFNLAGVSSSLGAPEATVGSVTLDASGNATGVQDLNSNAGSNPPSGPLTISSSTVLVGTSPGTATLFNGSETFNFAVYAISPTHLKFIETDVSPVLVGDVFSQSANTFPSGELAFTMAGLDYSSTNSGPLAVGGMMNAAGTSISAGVEDFNDAGTSNITSSSPISSPLTFTGTVAPSAGRSLLTLNTFENGNAGGIGTFTFAAYPSTGGTQLLEVDGAGITGGVAYPQNNTSFATGQGYGLNLTGSNGSQVDDIAEFTNTNNALAGLIDVNNAGATNPPLNFAGTYTPDTTNLGRGLITTTSGGVNLISYTVDSTDTIFIEIDDYQVAVGSIGQQAAENQGAIATRMAVLRPRALARGAWKKKPAAVGQGR